MSNPLARLLFKVLKAYHVSITYPAIERTIAIHPEYPSMQCISDALDVWKVKHAVVKISLNELRALDVPVIAHLKKGEYVWITQITDSKVYYWSANGKGKIENHERFEREWSGVALVIEDADDAGNPNYREERKKEVKEEIFRYIFSGGCMVLLTLLTFYAWTNDIGLPLLPKLLLLCINTAGCYISFMLIGQEKNQSNSLVQKFCRAGTHIDCIQVTKSRYSKLFGMISWAELGIAYFSAVTLWIAIAPVSADWLEPLWLFFLAALPFTVWSLFTQAFMIRKWCLFCCAIVFLLWVNASIFYFWVPFGYTVPVVESLLLTLLFSVCTAIVLYVSKTGESRDPYSEQRETARIKYDLKTLQSQLSENGYEINNAGFVWGNSQSSYEITLYVSIACSHCGTAVKELRRLTEIYTGLCFRLIFAVNTDNFEHKSNIITRHFISLYKAMNTNDFFDMLDAWYGAMNKKLDLLQKAFSLQSAPFQDNRKDMDDLYQFNQQAKISYTPAILLNGRLLSQLYSYNDLFGIARTLNAEI